MIIAVGEHSTFGRFSWELPECLQKKMALFRETLEKKGWPEEEVSRAEKVMIEGLQNLTSAFLNLVVGVYVMGGVEGEMATDMVRMGLSGMAQTALSLSDAGELESDDDEADEESL